MTLQEKIKKLIDKLIEQTDNGKVVWKTRTGAMSDDFVLPFKNNKLVVTPSTFQIEDEAGRILYMTTFAENDGERIIELYKEVRWIVRKGDEVLESILKQLLDDEL